MTTLVGLVLVLSTWGGGQGPGPQTPGDGRGVLLDAEPLRDLHRRTPQLKDDEVAPQQETEKQDRPLTTPTEPQSSGSPVVDFSWLEIYPRIGVAAFSSNYHVKPSACFGVAVRAPMPWLSPASNADGDYFGLFAELDLSVIKRDIVPTLDKPSGPILMVGFGIDYTFYRSESWLLMAELGAHYVNFGGITDLTNGLTPMVGVVGGVSLSRGLSLTVSPEIEYPKTGDYIMMITIGLIWEF